MSRTNPTPRSKEVRPKGEVRLVACGQTPDGRVLPIDDDSWDAGITEEEAFYLTKAPPYVEENRRLWVSGRDKLRAAFGDSP